MKNHLNWKVKDVVNALPLVSVPPYAITMKTDCFPEQVSWRTLQEGHRPAACGRQHPLARGALHFFLTPLLDSLRGSFLSFVTSMTGIDCKINLCRGFGGSGPLGRNALGNMANVHLDSPGRGNLGGAGVTLCYCSCTVLCMQMKCRPCYLMGRCCFDHFERKSWLMCRI